MSWLLTALKILAVLICVGPVVIFLLIAMTFHEPTMWWISVSILSIRERWRVFWSSLHS